jgi:hypothetical protein
MTQVRLKNQTGTRKIPLAKRVNRSGFALVRSEQAGGLQH